MKHRLKLLSILLTVCCLLKAETKKISGTVLSGEDGSPISGAIVTLFKADSIPQTRQTGNRGNFSFEIPAGLNSEIALTATALGFLDKELTFTPDFFVALGVYNLTGSLRSTMDIERGSYSCGTETIDKGAGKGFRPYFMLSYTFRKNIRKKMRFYDPDFVEEKGISLK